MSDFACTFPGPFSQHDVVVQGWRVPLLHAQFHDGGQITLVLDNRMGLELTTAEAERFVPFLADTIAVSLGYGAHPTEDMAALPDRRPLIAPRKVFGVVGFTNGAP